MSDPARFYDSLGPRFTSLVLFLSVLLAPAGARAGSLHEDLVGQINQAKTGQSVSGLVCLAEQLDIPQLEREMAGRGIQTRWRRHEYVVQAARALASRTQPALVAELQAGSAAGSVRSFQRFWITNAVAVEAEPAVFQRLALRGDVGMIYWNAPISLRLGWRDGDDRPHTRPTLDGRALQDGLVCINVQPAWDQGYTGAGRLVCDFDTGADGNHPALASRWRGAQPGVPWYHAWRDPYYGSQFPYDNAFHGTHTLGIMCAHPPGEDPLGVAYDAQWMAAGILISYNVQKIIDCYQWAADPDSIPTTIDDVPDVVNNSWGTSGDCDVTFWNAIDVIEAAGVANTIAVDNTGPGFASVNSAESRAATPFVNFGVGNVNPHLPDYPIAYSSGRGPSPCDYTSVKPEVTAPGTQIYSTFPGGGYGTMTGTSMACPHTSGAIAVLRQVNPSLTVDQAKEALMATAVDHGDPGEDNTYGWGIIDLGAAVQWVQAHTLALPPPRNLTGAVQYGNSVYLSWQSPTGIQPGNPLAAYRLYRTQDQDPYPRTPLATLPTFPTNYSDRNLAEGTYRYVVTAVYQSGGESEPSGEVIEILTEPADVVDASGSGPRSLLSVAPNPVRGGADVLFRASGSGPLSLEILDVSGRRVRSLRAPLAAPAGVGRATWDGRDDLGRPLAPGAYFALLRQDGRQASKRLIVLR